MMLTIFRRFRRDEIGSSHETLALVAAATTFVCIVAAHVLAQLSQSGGLPRIAIISSDGSTTTIGGMGRRFGDIDYSTTGSLSENLSRPVVLDPCTGRTD